MLNLFFADGAMRLVEVAPNRGEIAATDGFIALLAVILFELVLYLRYRPHE